MPAGEGDQLLLMLVVAHAHHALELGRDCPPSVEAFDWHFFKDGLIDAFVVAEVRVVFKLCDQLVELALDLAQLLLISKIVEGIVGLVSNLFVLLVAFTMLVELADRHLRPAEVVRTVDPDLGRLRPLPADVLSREHNH